MLTKPCPQTRSSSFSNIKHATSTVRDAVDKMGGGAVHVKWYLTCMAPLAKDLSSYIKDTKHALHGQIFQNIHKQIHLQHGFQFRILSLIPHHDGLI